MNLKLSLDEQLAEQARQVADSQRVKEELAELRRLSGRGNSRGWRFNREEVHERS